MSIPPRTSCSAGEAQRTRKNIALAHRNLDRRMLLPIVWSGLRASHGPAPWAVEPKEWALSGPCTLVERTNHRTISVITAKRATSQIRVGQESAQPVVSWPHCARPLGLSDCLLLSFLRNRSSRYRALSSSLMVLKAFTRIAAPPRRLMWIGSSTSSFRWYTL